MRKIELEEFKKIEPGSYVLIDTRLPDEFMEGFIEESLSVPFGDDFMDTLNDLIAENQAVVFLTGGDNAMDVLRAVKAAGNINTLGYLEGGFEAWRNADGAYNMLIGIDAGEFAMDYQFDEFFLVDVRSADEFAQEHVEDAENVVLNDLEQALMELDNTQSYYVYGATPADAVTAGSLFKYYGFERVRAVVADYEQIKASGIPLFVQKKKEKPGGNPSNSDPEQN
ncbi:MAG TPA: rhodanese-like domain-containing protein [Chitinophagales bacterium]|nr:rhodanese-like domain-containing protein [Chitinophagales bacterium]